MKIDPQLLNPIRFANLTPGSLGIVAANHAHFLAGTVRGIDVFTALDDEDPFHTAKREEWSRGATLQVNDISFEVDITTATRVDGNMELVAGMLLRHQQGISIVGTINKHADIIDLVGSFEPDQAKPVIGFSKWSIVHGQGDNKVTLFEHEVTKA